MKARTELRRLVLLHDAVDTLPLRRVQDAAAAEPERDMALVADEIAGTEVGLRHVFAGRLLLVGVPRDEPAGPAIRHVYEPGAVDPALGHPAPLVRRAEVVIRGPHTSPAVPSFLDDQGLPAQGLRHLLGVVPGLRPHGSDLELAATRRAAAQRRRAGP